MRALSECKVRRYSRRRRKKHHVGEFAQTAAHLHVAFDHPVDWDSVIDALLEVGHSLGLECSGLGSSGPCLEVDGEVVYVGYCAEAQRLLEDLSSRLGRCRKCRA